ncbi:MAG: dephospho-CoA kinase [Clostridia bacterium]|jgi:dephospho-CoA kinase
MVIGITGQIATGKSSLSYIFSQNGFVVFDADIVYKQLFDSNQLLRQEIFNHFGSLDKKVILNKVLKNKEMVAILNTITHKYVIIEIYDFLNNNKDKNIVLDVPIPVEKGFIDLCDIIIVTTASTITQKLRLLERYGIDEQQAEDRINMQMTMNEYIKIGDIILNTDKTNRNDLNDFFNIVNSTYMNSNKH